MRKRSARAKLKSLLTPDLQAGGSIGFEETEEIGEVHSKVVVLSCLQKADLKLEGSIM